MSHFEAVAAMALRPEARTRHIRTPMPVELVTGPPGSGKSTLVRERAGERDAVIDLDLIAEALGAKGQKWPGLMPLAWCARDAAVYAYAQHSAPINKLWIVACAPTRRDRQCAAIPFADVRLAVLEVRVEECLNRIDLDLHDRSLTRSPATDWRAVVEQWWAEYRRPTIDEGWSAVEVAG